VQAEVCFLPSGARRRMPSQTNGGRCARGIFAHQQYESMHFDCKTTDTLVYTERREAHKGHALAEAALVCSLLPAGATDGKSYFTRMRLLNTTELIGCAVAIAAMAYHPAGTLFTCSGIRMPNEDDMILLSLAVTHSCKTTK
jgi:hypothetical protein